MAGLLHGCARTTPRIRAELQASKSEYVRVPPLPAAEAAVA